MRSPTAGVALATTTAVILSTRNAGGGTASNVPDTTLGAQRAF